MIYAMNEGMMSFFCVVMVRMECGLEYGVGIVLLGVFWKWQN